MVTKRIGQLFDNLELALNSNMMGWSRNKNMWTSVSHDFAASASGDVHVFLSDGIGEWSVFWNDELPELRNNENVNTIYCHYLTPNIAKEVSKINKANPNDKKQQIMLLIGNKEAWIHKEVDATPIITGDVTTAQQQSYDEHQEHLLENQLSNEENWLKEQDVDDGSEDDAAEDGDEIVEFED